MTDNNKHKIVIVGGGAGGLELATRLGRKLGKPGLADVMLLDAASTHIWKPLLHEVASGTLAEEEEVEYLAQAHRNHFHFRLGRMEGLDRNKKEIYVSPTLNDEGVELIPRRTYQYDTLVMAVGSVSNTFKIPGVDKHCRLLDSTSQAFRFQKKLVETYLRTHSGASGGDKHTLSIVIVGAGATGVELSAELYEVTSLMEVYGLDKPGHVKITIIESAEQLLPALPQKLSLATQQQLLKLGIELKMGRRVSEVTETTLKTHDGEVFQADLMVWAAGIKAPDWMKDLGGLETNKINQLVVDQYLKTADDNVFAIGDCAACTWPGHQTNVPPRAQAAHQQASAVAKSIINRINGKAPVAFVYHDYGSLVSLGKYTTVGNLMGNLIGTVTIGGFIARVVYLSLYKMHQVAVHGYFRTAMQTISNLFRRSTHDKIKMH